MKERQNSNAACTARIRLIRGSRYKSRDERSTRSETSTYFHIVARTRGVLFLWSCSPRIDRACVWFVERGGVIDKGSGVTEWLGPRVLLLICIIQLPSCQASLTGRELGWKMRVTPGCIHRRRRTPLSPFVIHRSTRTHSTDRVSSFSNGAPRGGSPAELLLAKYRVRTVSRRVVRRIVRPLAFSRISWNWLIRSKRWNQKIYKYALIQ